MSEQMVNHKCPACSGPLHFEGRTGKLECEYCGSNYEVSEIETLYKEKENQAVNAMNEQNNSSWDMSSVSGDWGNDATKMKAYSCPSCGAELMCDENTAASCCPYCGNQTVIPGMFTGGLKPDYVIPFKTDKNMAVNALKKHVQGKFLLPSSFASGNHIQEIQGVYVPFWLFDAQADGEMRFHATNSEKKRQGDEEITTTKHYDVFRKGKISFEKVPVDASSRMPDKHMDSIEPYDYRELKSFSTAYMPGYLADKYDVDVKECGKRMEERCAKTFETEVVKSLNEYENKSVTESSVFVKKGTVHYAMLPVWLLATKWNGENFLFAMNGQSGKMVGDLPLDKPKYWGMSLGLSALFIAVMLCLSNFVFAAPMTGAGFVVGCILLPILLAFIISGIFKNQLKSVNGFAAGRYMDEKGLIITGKTDRFLRTTVEKRKISSGK